ncbi:MAG: glutamate--tRNA ligase, partial [Candidatus Methanomethylophilaceae archaeon]
MSIDQAENVIRKYALQNAVFFNGKASPKAVAGKVLGECPELRSRSAEVLPMVNDIVAEVNSLDL